MSASLDASQTSRNDSEAGCVCVWCAGSDITRNEFQWDELIYCKENGYDFKSVIKCDASADISADGCQTAVEVLRK